MTNHEHFDVYFQFLQIQPFVKTDPNLGPMQEFFDDFYLTRFGSQDDVAALRPAAIRVGARQIKAPAFFAPWSRNRDCPALRSNPLQ